MTPHRPMTRLTRHTPEDPLDFPATAVCIKSRILVGNPELIDCDSGRIVVILSAAKNLRIHGQPIRRFFAALRMT